MPAEAALLRSLLKDVTLEGIVVTEKKKLLWMLGWGQDRAGAWAELLVHWKEIGQDKDTLYGFEVHGKIVLSMHVVNVDLPLLATWANLPVGKDN